MGKFIDLTGQRFGRLEVIMTLKNAVNGEYMWLCKCDCGGECISKMSNLRSGKTKSCGCIQKEEIDNYIGKNCVDDTRINAFCSNLSKNNTSGHKGVVYRNKRGKWQSQIQFQKKTIYLGIYSNKKDAIKAREKAEEYYSNIINDYNLCVKVGE